ncbi:MAG: cysteine--tRNA ligase [Nitrospirae bacterium]|nr:MAG: cysteine--tRNA ligase [Nitrospirota bacterium]
MNPLKVFNTLTGSKVVFEPLIPGQVRMYVCGVTVYDECHLGHARSALVFETIRRHLEHSGLAVTFVKNFTDVDDKIINRAHELGLPWQEVTKKYIAAYYRDMKRLRIEQATIEPKATEHMPEITGLIQRLLDKSVAYQIGSDVYFQVERYAPYGRLSKRKLEDMQAGARVEVDERKRHPMDFALWKGAKPGEPAWPSPWGDGRPGWHIECSAMSMKHLGETFDIHGGGADLIFPHHENEIAQSCAATGKEFARYWLHNGFVQINQEKMSKSLGNFFTIREIFEKSEWPEEITGEILRYFLLTNHYRSPLDFSDQGLREAKYALDGFYDLFNRLKETAKTEGPGNEKLTAVIEQTHFAFEQAMDDDFNTPAAIAELQGFRSEANKLLETGLSTQAREQARQTFRLLGSVMGLFQLEKWQFNVDLSDIGVKGLTDADIKSKVEKRDEARRRKDFKRADEIRAELAALGIIIEDKTDGTTRWKR